jgi:exopolyphosphatase/guanosine-5'-triphosphate,3'-diphosphate pyrophosphatase
MAERAIIDIGSNTVRLVIYGGPLRTPLVLHNEKVTAKLGKSVAENGKLGNKASAAALSALGRYAKLLELRRVEDVMTVATAAVRDAENGSTFLANVAKLGLEPRLLSGEEEAIAGALGVAAAFPGARGAVADLGGGSLELTALENGRAHHGTSLPLGSLRLPALREGGTAKFGRRIHSIVAKAPLPDSSGLPLYAVGGSCRALAQLLMRKLHWPLDDPHGFELSGRAALLSFRSIARGQLGSNTQGLSSTRLAAMPDAAALMASVVRELQPSAVVFSSWGLREGLLHRSLDEQTRAQDPLLAGAGAFAKSMGVCPQLAATVAGWTASVRTAQAPPERLRLAATLLGLASMQIEPNLRPQHCVDWALRKRWVGVDVAGRAIIAMTLLANTGRTEVPEALVALAPPTAFQAATVWGLGLRLCRKLTGLALEALTDSSLGQDASILRLNLGAEAVPLFSDAIEKDLRLLSSALGCEAKFTKALSAAD